MLCDSYRPFINAVVMGLVILVMSLLFGASFWESAKWSGMTMIVAGVVSVLLGDMNSGDCGHPH